MTSDRASIAVHITAVVIAAIGAVGAPSCDVRRDDRSPKVVPGVASVAAASMLAAALPLVSAPQSSPCTAPEARAFDFWIGDWDIRQQILRKDGTWLELPARTLVTATLDGCALIEQWQGQVSFFWEGMQEPEAMTGLSVRAYDPTTAQWFIHWMDTRAPRFGAPYVGTFVNGRGAFFREFETPDGRRVGRITFSDIAANAVAWALAVSSDGGKTWQTLWTMEMQRRSAR